MKKFFAIGLTATLCACGGGGVSGTYVNPADNTTMEINGDNATVTAGGMQMSGPVKQANGVVSVTMGKETKDFKVDDKGCLVNAEIGTLCKK